MVSDSAHVHAPKRDLLFLTQRIPYPPIKGEKIRPLQILKHFGKTHNVHLGCLIDDPRDWEHVETVRALCTDAYFGGLDRGRDNLSHVKALLTGQALSVALYRHQGLAEWTRHMLDRVRPDVIFICSSNMAHYVLDHPHKGRKRICDLADVDSEKWRAYAAKASFPMNWVYGREARLVFNLEKRIAHETDYSTFVSEPEAKIFRELIPDRAKAIVGVPSGVEYAYFDPDGDYAAPFDTSLPTYVFTGTMDYIPNVDAVTWFAKGILPLIRRTLPTAQFFIVGSNPSPAVQALAAIAGVHVTGRVPDVRPYLAYCTAGVAPMRIARGIQNKVMEAMSMAKPVVVTSDALEGIDAVEGSEVVLANDEAAFAATALRMYQEPEMAKAIGAAARKRVVENFSWEGRLGGFDSLIAA
ncbi:MAG TPA: TIGR03087 family PEP-CTERM/XrtA system glycosyltransferase [Alphaproteobacteria bacterium]|jgi:sugar transferase (PEP-CTERM/EpsH1 system associated)|nr:TIGR03087 family PEP-CTERM/XrtA system glycosyltransferase [Alphaproteobacteria bacterium]